MTGDIMKRGLSHKKYLVHLVKPCISANSLQKENNSIVVNYKVMPWWRGASHFRTTFRDVSFSIIMVSVNYREKSLASRHLLRVDLISRSQLGHVTHKKVSSVD